VRTEPEPSASRGHLVVCGDDALALRIVEELTIRYDEDVTVILPSAQRGRGPMIARLPRVRLVERAEPDHQAFLAAGLRTARAVALVSQDDLRNFHAALRAQEINARLKLIIASFNAGLGDRIRSFFSPDCLVLSQSGLAAPSFVAAALEEPGPRHVNVADRVLGVARRGDTDPALVICGLSPDPGGGSPRLAAPEDVSSQLVLAVTPTPASTLASTLVRQTRESRHRLRAAVRMLRFFFSGKIGKAYASVSVVLLLGFALLALGPRYTWDNALYLTFLDAAGAATTGVKVNAWEKFAQFLLTFAGMFIQATLTTLLLSFQLPALQTDDRPLRNHVILAGLGNVGTLVLHQLINMDMDVVCIDKDENAAGVAEARRLGIRVVIGETHREATLRDAGITSCQALISVTSSDPVNLETALVARALADDPRIVLRLYDDDLARRIEEHDQNKKTISRSVPYVAAPQFAAAMLEHEVLITIPVDRHVLLIAKVVVAVGAELAGAQVSAVHDDSDNVRLIALQRQGGDETTWSPRADAEIAAGDALFVLATRAGLGRLLGRSRPQ
jgi:Trk K+ transport system NAD-binding subunit